MEGVATSEQSQRLVGGTGVVLGEVVVLRKEREKRSLFVRAREETIAVERCGDISSRCCVEVVDEKG